MQCRRLSRPLISSTVLLRPDKSGLATAEGRASVTRPDAIVAWQSHKIKDQKSKIKMAGKNTKTVRPT